MSQEVMVGMLIVLFAIPISIVIIRRIVIKLGAKYDPSKLKENAKVIRVSHYYSRHNKSRERGIVTRIKFDDGFVYDAECSYEEKFCNITTWTVTREAQELAIKMAKIAHDKEMGLPTEDMSYALSTFKYKCGGCGNKGPYGDACPNCGSRLKVADK